MASRHETRMCVISIGAISNYAPIDMTHKITLCRPPPPPTCSMSNTSIWTLLVTSKRADPCANPSSQRSTSEGKSGRRFVSHHLWLGQTCLTGCVKVRRKALINGARNNRNFDQRFHRVNVPRDSGVRINNVLDLFSARFHPHFGHVSCAGMNRSHHIQCVVGILGFNEK